MTENNKLQRLGVFTAGFRWSGSSAVSDWLESFSAVKKPEGCEASNDEIRALNYGLTIFLKQINKRFFVGEKLARYSLYPDDKGWGNVFGRPLSSGKGIFYPLILLGDDFFMQAAKNHLTPGLDRYTPLLDSQLGTDYRRDAEYIESVKYFNEAVRKISAKHPASWNDVKGDPDLSDAVSSLFALFYDRYFKRGYVPVFDNAISGLTPQFFDLLDEKHFRTKVIIFVVRDPRDQFAEQVRYSAKTWSFMAGNFISDYKKKYQMTKEYVESAGKASDRVVRLVSFEDFVYNTDNTRSEFEDILFSQINESGINTVFDKNRYSPERSMKNIGIWKEAGMKKEMKKITENLFPFLKEQAG